jgi:GT2 family glycosyltransferase
MDKVSVIIVNWNGKKWLRKCLSSLSIQTYKNIEIIVVDNASIDDSIGYINEKFPKVRIVKNIKNLGYPKAVNRGVRIARGSYLILINNDTWVEKDFVERLFNFYKDNSYDIVTPREKHYDGSTISDKYSPIDFLGNPAFGVVLKTDKLFALSVCLFLKKELYLETEGLDNDFFLYYEDVDWFWRLQLLGKKFTMVENVFVYHYGSGSSPTGLNYNMFLWRNQNSLQMLLKNYSAISLLFILPIYFIQNIFEILLFLLILKPKLAYSYLQGWIFNIKNLRRILKKRSWIQKNRVVGDLSILKNMYPLPMRLIGLIKRI